MSDFRKKVLIGNIVLCPDIIKQYLIKSHYFLVYNSQGEKLTLNANHGRGGEVLFEIRNVSYESACKLAEGLGLKCDSSNELSCVWSKWNPILILSHDGSADAETLRMELLKLGIPHIIYSRSETLALSNGQGIHKSPAWTVQQMLEIIQEVATRCEEQLSTKP